MFDLGEIKDDEHLGHTETELQSRLYVLRFKNIWLCERNIRSACKRLDKFLIAFEQHPNVLLSIHVRADDQHQAVLVMISIVYDFQRDVVWSPSTVEVEQFQLAVTEGLPLTQTLSVVEE